MPPNVSPTQPVRNGSSGRTPKGKFAEGNKLGRGNPHLVRIREYNDAIRYAIKTGDIREVMVKLLTMAKRGDLAAAKLVLDRTLGRANAAPIVVDGADLGIDALATSSDVKRASEAIVRGMTEGRISVDDGSKLATVVELVRKCIETHELDHRIAQLERGRSE